MSCRSRSARSTCAAAASSSGRLLDQILGRHDYPEPVARLLAEACVLTVLLGTSLKFEGKFILQTRSDGPVDMLVADFSTPQVAARLCALRRGAAGRGDRRRRGLARKAARQRRAGADHRPGRAHAALSGHRPARRHLAGRGRRASISASRSRSRPMSGCRSPSMVMPGRGRQPRALACRRHPGAVPAGGAGAAAAARPAGRRRRPAAGDHDPTDNSWQEVLALLATDRAVGTDRPDGRRRAAALPPVPRARRARLRRRPGRRRVLLLAREDPRHPRRFFRRGDRRQHRGRRHHGQLRVLLEGLRIRPGGIRTRWSETFAARP